MDLVVHNPPCWCHGSRANYKKQCELGYSVRAQPQRLHHRLLVNGTQGDNTDANKVGGAAATHELSVLIVTVRLAIEGTPSKMSVKIEAEAEEQCWRYYYYCREHCCVCCAVIAALFMLVSELGCCLNSITELHDEYCCVCNNSDDDVADAHQRDEVGPTEQGSCEGEQRRVENSNEYEDVVDECEVQRLQRPLPVGTPAWFCAPVDLDHLSSLASLVSRGTSKYAPVLTSEGSGGAYFLRSTRNRKLAVFKPMTEEPGAPENPRPVKSDQQAPARFGFVPGEGALKEVLAYLIDKEHFAGVPPTVLMDIPLPGKCPQLGSVQQFVEHDMCAWDVGPKNFSIDEVHAIALLDLRLCNTDRHGGNILLAPEGYSPVALLETCDSEYPEGTEGVDDYNSDGQHEYDKKVRLVPIDHGYCLPAYPHLSELWFEWVTWPQCKQPLSNRAVEYVSRIDDRADAELALAMGLISEESAITLCIGTMLVKRCVAAGLTVLEIAKLACRLDGPDTPSTLETICARAEKECAEGVSSKGGPVPGEEATQSRKAAFLADTRKEAARARVALPLGGVSPSDLALASRLLGRRDAFFGKVGQLLGEVIRKRSL